VDVSHFQCLLNPCEHIWGDIINAYINCTKAEPHLMCRGGRNVYLEDTLTSELHWRYGKYLNNYKPDKRTDAITERISNYINHDMVFIPINIKNVHWYLMVINAKKRRVQYLDSLKDLLGHADADFVVEGIRIQIDVAKGDINTTEMRWPDLDIHKWPVEEVFEHRLQYDSSSCGLFLINFME